MSTTINLFATSIAAHHLQGSSSSVSSTSTTIGGIGFAGGFIIFVIVALLIAGVILKFSQGRSNKIKTDLLIDEFQLKREKFEFDQRDADRNYEIKVQSYGCDKRKSDSTIILNETKTLGENLKNIELARKLGLDTSALEAEVQAQLNSYGNTVSREAEN